MIINFLWKKVGKFFKFSFINAFTLSNEVEQKINLNIQYNNILSYPHVINLKSVYPQIFNHFFLHRVKKDFVCKWNDGLEKKRKCWNWIIRRRSANKILIWRNFASSRKTNYSIFQKNGADSQTSGASCRWNVLSHRRS